MQRWLQGNLSISHCGRNSGRAYHFLVKSLLDLPFCFVFIYSLNVVVRSLMSKALNAYPWSVEVIDEAEAF